VSRVVTEEREVSLLEVQHCCAHFIPVTLKLQSPLRGLKIEEYQLGLKSPSRTDELMVDMRYLGVYFVQSRYLKCSLTGQPTVYLVKLDAAPLRKLSCSLFQVNAYRFYFMV